MFITTRKEQCQKNPDPNLGIQNSSRTFMPVGTGTYSDLQGDARASDFGQLLETNRTQILYLYWIGGVVYLGFPLVDIIKMVV